MILIYTCGRRGICFVFDHVATPAHRAYCPICDNIHGHHTPINASYIFDYHQCIVSDQLFNKY